MVLFLDVEDEYLFFYKGLFILMEGMKDSIWMRYIVFCCGKWK